MSKPFSITRDMIISMIEDVNEHITSVEFATIPHVVTAIMDSIHEDAVWTESQIDVTESSITAVVNEWISDRATNDESTVFIYQGLIGTALTGIQNAVEINEPRAARQIAEIFVEKITAAGGKAYLNPFWYGVSRDDATIEAPGTRHGNHYFEYMKWPTSAVGDIVTIEGASYKVVANWVSPGRSGVWTEQFSLWAAMPV